MNESQLKALEEAIEEGLKKSIEKIGEENLKYIPWFSILTEENLENLETF